MTNRVVEIVPATTPASCSDTAGHLLHVGPRLDLTRVADDAGLGIG
jgi:hypothetical protein